jgi:hypothetical protein
MALKLLAKIGGEIAASHQITHIAMVHRLGRMLIGEASAVVVVTAPHRRPAFAAALEGIARRRLAPRMPLETYSTVTRVPFGSSVESRPIRSSIRLRMPFRNSMREFRK